MPIEIEEIARMLPQKECHNCSHFFRCEKGGDEAEECRLKPNIELAQKIVEVINDA